MSEDTFGASLWSALSAPAQTFSPLQPDEACDVLVVGAGFLGLSLALHLAERGASVVVLEAREPGFGASGRNTGFVVPSLKTALGPADVGSILGEDVAERLVRLVGESGSTVFDLIRRLGIDCSAEQTGWMQPAHTAAMARVLEARQKEWRKRGREVDFLSASDTQAAFGAPGYHGALLEKTGGQLNPLAYARGLAAAAVNAGAKLHADCPVQALERTAQGWAAKTPQGEVRAARVVLTTNALVGALAPSVSASIVPVVVHQIASQPIPDDQRTGILPLRTPSADTRRHTLAVRWSPDNRLMTGGLVLPGPAALQRASTFFARRLERFFPGVAPVRPEFTWRGVIAVTTDSLPRFLSLGDGLDAVIGCNGRGIALTTALGERTAALLAGDIGLDEFPLRPERPQPIAGRAFAGYAPAFWLPWSALRDRIEAGR